MRIIKQTSNMQVFEQKVGSSLFTFSLELRECNLPWRCQAWHSGKPAIGIWKAHGNTKQQATQACIKLIHQSLRAARMTIPR